MTYILNNTQKIKMLKEKNIYFTATKNIIFVDGFDCTNMHDDLFIAIIEDTNDELTDQQ